MNYGDTRDGVTTTGNVGALADGSCAARRGAEVAAGIVLKAVAWPAVQVGQGRAGAPGGTPRRIGALVQYWVRRRTHFAVGSQIGSPSAGPPPGADSAPYNTG